MPFPGAQAPQLSQLPQLPQLPPLHIPGVMNSAPPTAAPGHAAAQTLPRQIGLPQAVQQITSPIQTQPPPLVHSHSMPVTHASGGLPMPSIAAPTPAQHGAASTPMAHAATAAPSTGHLGPPGQPAARAASPKRSTSPKRFPASPSKPMMRQQPNLQIPIPPPPSAVYWASVTGGQAPSSQPSSVPVSAVSSSVLTSINTNHSPAIDLQKATSAPPTVAATGGSNASSPGNLDLFPAIPKLDMTTITMDGMPKDKATDELTKMLERFRLGLEVLEGGLKVLTDAN
ncbi:uncharacterized protein V1510DRAFT_415609 [Dipodascopsis tothii]|uniref:uncharacterized protein n=1 Tax=Dipodascopsis tothii TaxID=44089 RepID=UPI0034CF85BB